MARGRCAGRTCPADHKFITRTNDEGKTTVIFGNGRQGARLPTGTANVRAVYRNGIGKPGNVQAGQISLLVTRPPGVKGVVNPLRASGGADKESRDQARKNVPLAVAALDRLVSIQDYADFTRTFAGIAKASARRASDGHRELVHITMAGVDDVPIDPPSDLYRNLLTALHDCGDPDLPVQVDLRELLMLVIEAKLYLQADHVREKVMSDVKTKLPDTFSFDRRELGQDAVLSEVIAVMQAVPGVAYVDGGALYLETPQPWTENPPMKVRRWDQTGTEKIKLSDGAVPIAEGTSEADWIDLEDGLQVQFQPDGNYRTGDYWLIPARTTGTIEWPNELDAKGNPVSIAQAPRGIIHHYAPLWIISVSGGAVSPGNDLRCTFSPRATCPT